MKSLPLVIPPKTVFDQFEDLLEPLFNEQECIEQESHYFATLRDVLLPRLMSGEVTVNEL